MWNAKRILILFTSLVVAGVCYSVYTVALGHIDAMPRLPVTWGPPRPGEVVLPPDAIEKPVDQKLSQSFGPNCQEKQWPLRLWLADKGIAFAAGDFIIEKDGKVRMAPFSAAMYHKSKAPGAYPEISTIRCDVALITFDRPVANYSDLHNREVIGVELIGKMPGITMTNNRRTAEKGDDVDILIAKGILYYQKTKNLIWTEDVVCLRDFQTKPPTEIRGRGMKMHLLKEASAKQAPAVKVKPAQRDNDNGNIEKIHLLADVDMHFWVDAKAGFLGGVPNEKNPPKRPANVPPEKAHIHIKTGGPFFYDLTKEVAWFESPPPRDGEADGQNLPIAPDQVHVERLQTVDGKARFDQLICDRLDLKFRKRDGAVDAGAVNGGDKEIDTALATRRGKNEVVLSLDSEQMAAYGNELFYRCGDLTTGPMTILKGDPLKTVKDGHKMVCKELQLIGANRAGDGQRAFAKGKGQIDLIDAKDPVTPTWPTHILWDETLEIVKEKEGGKVFDLMTVKGAASFIDDQQKQELHGETIQVWVEQTQEGQGKPQGQRGQRQELRRVLAIDNVRATSPEFVVRKTNRLYMIFLPQAPENHRLPDVVVAKPADGPGTLPRIEPDGKVPMQVKKEPALDQKNPMAAKVDEKKAPPIELTGNDITATVFTLGGKKELQDLAAKGNVYVFQAGDKAGEKRVDITGQLLTVKYAPKGHTMVVHGDSKALARLEMGEMVVWGPIVTINKGENRADVAGHGAMQMPSNKNLDGTDAPKDAKPTKMTIYWTKSMDFDGRNANFHGGVQGFQQDSYSHMKCENMTAIMDRHISFQEGQKSSQSAKIDKVFCDKNVFIDDSKVDDKKALVQRSLLQGTLLKVDNLDGGTRLSGPGEVRLFAKGNGSLEIAPPAKDPNAKPGKTEWKLTHVKFRDLMFSNTKAATKNAKFFGYDRGVEVYHFGTTKIHDTMDSDKVMKDQLYLRCEILEVEGRQSGDRTTQYIIAKRNVDFKTDKYIGYADIVTYNEATEIVIFEATNGNVVRLYEMRGNTPQPISVSTSKVLYNRKTGTIDSAGVKSITN